MLVAIGNEILEIGGHINSSNTTEIIWIQNRRFNKTIKGLYIDMG